jgi:hypothetical protein
LAAEHKSLFLLREVAALLLRITPEYVLPSLVARCFFCQRRRDETSVTSCNTQSGAPEDGQNSCPKHVELTGIINKLLLLHLVGCLYYLYQ